MLLSVALVLWASIASCAGLDLYQPTRLTHGHSTTALLFYPGTLQWSVESGQFVNHQGLSSWQVLPANVMSLEVLQNTSLAETSVSTSLSEYHRGNAIMGNSTEVILHLFEDSDSQLLQISQWLEGERLVGFPYPLVTLMGSTSQVMPAVDLLRRLHPGLAIGLVVEDASHAFNGTYDYLIVNPDVFPEEHRNQSAAAYARRLAQGRPVIFQTKSPDFFCTVAWRIGGVAGIQLFTRDQSTQSNTEFWHQARAINTFPQFFHQGHIHIAPRSHPQVIAAFTDLRYSWAGLLDPVADADMRLPAFITPVNRVTPSYYRPISDERIVHPSFPVDSASEVQFHTPETEGWIHFVSGHPPQIPDETTTSLKFYNY